MVIDQSECEVFLERMVRIMSQESSIWMKALAMEVLKDICGSEKLLKYFCALTCALIFCSIGLFLVGPCTSIMT